MKYEKELRSVGVPKKDVKYLAGTFASNIKTAHEKALKDKGTTKRGHNVLLKEKYGKETPSVKKYLKKFTFKDGHYE